MPGGINTRCMVQIYTYFWTVQNLTYFCALTKTMIQRIQSIFIIIAALCAVALHFTGMDVDIFGNHYIVAGITLFSFILALVSLFNYKNRNRQIMMNNFNMMLNALLIGVLLYWLLSLSGGIDFPEKGIEPAFPVIAIFCLFMANLNIHRDERLVKSVDRLR